MWELTVLIYVLIIWALPKRIPLLLKSNVEFTFIGSSFLSPNLNSDRSRRSVAVFSQLLEVATFGHSAAVLNSDWSTSVYCSTTWPWSLKWIRRLFAFLTLLLKKRIARNRIRPLTLLWCQHFLENVSHKAVPCPYFANSSFLSFCTQPSRPCFVLSVVMLSQKVCQDLWLFFHMAIAASYSIIALISVRGTWLDIRGYSATSSALDYNNTCIMVNARLEPCREIEEALTTKSRWLIELEWDYAILSQECPSSRSLECNRELLLIHWLTWMILSAAIDITWGV